MDDTAGSTPTTPDEGPAHAAIPPATETRAHAAPAEDAEERPGALHFSSTVTRGTYHQCGTGRRVKLYILEGQAWTDRGTGYCAGVYNEAKDEALLVTRKEEHCEALGDVLDAGEDDDDAAAPSKYMLVIDERLDTDDYLLSSPVVKDDVYQRQQDTLVVWTEPDGSDLALSFQEPEGCNEVWDFLTEVQLHFMLNKDPTYSAADRERLRAAYAEAHDDASDFRLPAPDADNVAQIAHELRDACQHGPVRREKVVEWLLNEDYIRKLIPLFHAAEAHADLAVLHTLYDIVKLVLTMNDNVLIEYLLEDDVFFAAVGMLEYSPEFPTLKASYRDYLQRQAHFHPVVEFDDPNMVTKIYDTYRLVYLRDVILARLFDDATLSILSSLVFFYQSDIVNYCVGHKRCLEQVLDIVQRTEVPARKHEAVLFLHQLCTMAKQIQLPGRMTLFRSLVDRNLLQVVEFALTQRAPMIRNAGAEILASTIEYDSSSVRAYILAQVARNERPLLALLRDVLLGVYPAGFQGQIAETLRVLLDVSQEGISNSPAAQGSMLRAASDPERFLAWLYKGEIEQLFAPLLRLPRLAADAPRLPRLPPADATRLGHLAHLLCHVITEHGFRSQYYVLNAGVARHVGALLRAREKPMRLAAVHVFRTCLAAPSQFLHRHLVDIGVVGELLTLLEHEAPRDNLVSSACLGFFEQVRRDQVHCVREHLLHTHAAQLERLEQVATLQPCLTALRMEPEAGAETAAAPAPEDPAAAAADVAAEEAASEEAYFATDDAEPLVPYGDDAEDDEAAAELSASVARMHRRRKRTSDERDAGEGEQEGEEDDDEDDDDDLLQHAAKRRPSPSRRTRLADDKKLTLRLSDEARQRAGAETNVAS
ncbi:hypothetical protein CBS9595_004005 [Malassezia furfur]|nr:hypothetical protein CBS9595_004005 [Malassezia furfur]